MEEEKFVLPNLPDVLSYSLEERRKYINGHDEEMKNVCSKMAHYIEDVNYAKSHNLNPSAIVNYTYNLLLILIKANHNLNTYEYLKCRYLLYDEYDKANAIWELFSQNAQIIGQLIDAIGDDYFEGDIDEMDFLYEIIPASFDKIDIDRPMLIGNMVLSLSLGPGLFRCLRIALRNTESWLKSLKDGLYLDHEEDSDYDYTYLINYNLYREKYWPNEGRNFRMHVKDRNFHKDVTPEVLERLLWDEQRDFESNKIGRLWRDYLYDKKAFYIEAKRINMDEAQWKYYFKSICRFEEYEKWIDELKNPPESDEDKEKRELLLRSNSIFDIQKMRVKGIDILRLHSFINKHFIDDNMKAYYWYALRQYLEKLDILLDNCTNVAFEEQMNKSEWFKDAPKPCSDNAMNYYNFLNGKHHSLWLKVDIPGGSRATHMGLRKIYNVYSELELNEKELMR